MPRKRDLIISSLTKKGFRQDDGDHINLIYVRQDGKTSSKRTKISRGTSHKEVSDINLGQMARQVGLSRKQFEQLVDCTMDQATYEKTANP
jgi:hypothetical protein